MSQEYEIWHKLKSALNGKPTRTYFQVRDVWWCHLGQNIGHEENGKGTEFRRPILVIGKINRNLLWALPFTTKIKPHNSHYMVVNYRNRDYSIITSQLRAIDSKRLIRKVRKLSIEEHELITKQIITRLKKRIP